jgi:PAS domain S-box-containing protein
MTQKNKTKEELIKDIKFLKKRIAEFAAVVTERKQTEEVLKVTLGKYKTIFDFFPIGITVSDSAGKILESNLIAEKLLGLSRKEQSRRKIDGKEWQIVRPDGTPMPAEEYASVQALKENRRVENIEMGIVKTHDEITWINVTAIPLPLKGHGVVITYSDITERKKIEDALRLSEERLKKAQTMAQIGNWEWNIKTGFLHWEDINYRLFGLPPETIPSMEAFFGTVHPDDLELVKQSIQNALDGKPYDLNMRIRRSDGNERVLRGWGEIERDTAGKAERFFGTVQDITKCKQAEEEKHSLQEQLIRSEKLAAVGELIAGVVHEINNPLTGIKGLSELLMNETQDEEKKKDLQFIHQSSERIEKIVKNLQRFARREEPIRKQVNIHELIEAVITIRNYEMESRNIKVIKHYQPDLPPVMADPSQLEQVFLSLIINAEDAIHDNQEKAGTLTIATSAVSDNAEKGVVIEFSDTGAGIPSDVFPKLFNPFFTTKGVGKGTGLGLSVSYGIIKEHGGEISARNRAEGGAVFTIQLPVGGVKDD